MNEDEVREVVANYRANHMPLDAVVLDIDYMERYKDFTVDAQRFPRFADFAAEMKAQGIHLVPIIDAAVKVEEGYEMCIRDRCSIRPLMVWRAFPIRL